MAGDTFVKICGISDEGVMRHVSALASAAGVVVDGRSRRRVTPEQARELIEIASIPTYLVARETDTGEWDRLLDATGARHVQVHADDAHHTVTHLRDQCGAHVIQAFTVPRHALDAAECAKKLIVAISKSEADRIILDSGAGTGTVHDLDVSRMVAREYDVILAGGLSPETITSVLSYVDPWGVDVSSGVELSGRKDERTITEFIKLVRKGGESP